jgi:hypothetical protein
MVAGIFVQYPLIPSSFSVFSLSVSSKIKETFFTGDFFLTNLARLPAS